MCPCRLPHGTVHPVVHHHAWKAAHPEQPVWDWHTVSAEHSLYNMLKHTLSHDVNTQNCHTQAEPHFSIDHSNTSAQQVTKKIFTPTLLYLHLWGLSCLSHLGTWQHLAELCQPTIFSDFCQSKTKKLMALHHVYIMLCCQRVYYFVQPLHISEGRLNNRNTDLYT